ncbi:MAG: hypothetical protein PHF00_03535 [Elusimicrobia bacterium]|nr:hypothetical protein [Elusimicrobiota bacterium]
MKRLGLGLAAVAVLAGCRGIGSKDYGALELERNFADSDRQVRETRTLSSLVQLEASLSDYVKDERRIPDRLEQLIPKYLSGIPSVDIAVRGHRETAAVQYYPADLLVDGLIDGTRLRDTGKWGYAHNERQVVIFVDCTHPSSRGKPWYQEKAGQ